MEKVTLILRQGPQVHVGIIYQQIYALYVVLQNGIVKSCVPFLTFVVDVIGVPHFLQNVLDVVEHALVTCQHERCLFILVKIFEISPTFNQNTEVFCVHRKSCIVNRPSPQVVLHIDDIRENLKQFPEELRVIRNSSSMNRRAKVDPGIMLDQVVLLEVIELRDVADQQIIVVLRVAERVAIRNGQLLSQQGLGGCKITTSDYTCNVSKDLFFELSIGFE